MYIRFNIFYKFIYDIKITPDHFDDNKFNYKILKNVAGINKNHIDSIVSSSMKSARKFRPQLIKRQIDFKIKSILEEYKLDFKGMYFSEFPIRTFTSTCNLSHVLGYLKQNNKGEITPYGGIEEIYNSNLLGKDGVEYHLINNIGIDQGVFNFENRNYPSEQGENLFLTIDSKLQSFCEDFVLIFQLSEDRRFPFFL